MPWHVPHDMKVFRHLTLNNPVILGRITWNSLPRPLAKRTNIILSSSLKDSSLPQTDTHLHIARSPEEALHTAQLALTNHNNTQPAIMIIGGTSVYHEFLPQADEVYISHLDLAVTEPDSFFPQSNLKNWTHKKDEDFVYTPQRPSSQDVAFIVKRYLSPRIASALHEYPQHMHNRLTKFSLDLPQKSKVYSPGSGHHPTAA